MNFGIEKVEEYYGKRVAKLVVGIGVAAFVVAAISALIALIWPLIAWATNPEAGAQYISQVTSVLTLLLLVLLIVAVLQQWTHLTERKAFQNDFAAQQYKIMDNYLEVLKQSDLQISIGLETRQIITTALEFIETNDALDERLVELKQRVRSAADDDELRKLAREIKMKLRTMASARRLRLVAVEASERNLQTDTAHTDLERAAMERARAIGRTSTPAAATSPADRRRGPPR